MLIMGNKNSHICTNTLIASFLKAEIPDLQPNRANNKNVTKGI